jgi:hypothetical protein
MTTASGRRAQFSRLEFKLENCVDEDVVATLREATDKSFTRLSEALAGIDERTEVRLSGTEPSLQANLNDCFPGGTPAKAVY